MIESVIFVTESENLYLYDDSKMLSLLIHPELKKVHDKSGGIDPYYVKKYEYLKRYGFFSEPKSADFGVVNESMVEECICNVPQIIFEVTDSCNLDCTYCGYGELYGGHSVRNTRNIDIQKAVTFLKYILDIKHKHKKSRLSIGFYGGEALINMRFIKHIVTVTNKLNTGKELDVQYSMTTNATLIHKYINFFVENDFDISISLDGNEKNHSYRIFRDNKKNSFERVLENVDMIQMKYTKYFMNHVNFISVLHNRNSIKSTHDFIYGRYHKIPIIIELATKDVKEEKRAIFDSMFHKKRESEYEYMTSSDSIYKRYYTPLVYNEVKDFLNFYSINYYLSDLTSLLISKDKYYPTSTCLPLGRKIFFTTQGKLLPCEKVNEKYCMGNVENGVEIDVAQITRQHIHYYDNLKKVCQHCYAYKFCGLCMYHIGNLDRLDTEEFICEKFYDKKTFTEKMYRVFSHLEKHPNDFFYILENSKKQ